MTTASNLAGFRIMAPSRLYIPAWGIPWAEVTLDQEATLKGRVQFALADLAVSCTVMSGGIGPTGRSRYRLAAGAGGWGRTVKAKPYANDAGVKASTVIADVARDSGETIDVATLPLIHLGPGFTRAADPAARVLEQIAPQGWYVGEDGISRIGRRASRKLTSAAVVISKDLARGVVSLAADSIVGLVPGVIVEGIEAVDVLHEITAAGLRTTIWGAGISSTTRRLTAIRRLVEQLDPDRRFRATYEYRVVTQDGERVNLQVVRVSTGMPDLPRVTVRPGVSGARADLALGSRVLVTFVDADPARPTVTGFEDAEGDGFLPAALTIDANGIMTLGHDDPVIGPAVASTVAPKRFVRYGDPIIFGPPGNGIVAAPALPFPTGLSSVRGPLP